MTPDSDEAESSLSRVGVGAAIGASILLLAGRGEEQIARDLYTGLLLGAWAGATFPYSAPVCAAFVIRAMRD